MHNPPRNKSIKERIDMPLMPKIPCIRRSAGSQIDPFFRFIKPNLIPPLRIVDPLGRSTAAVQRKIQTPPVPGLRTELKSAARPGELLFMMELRDSRTERPLGRAADGAAHPTFAHDGTDWTGVEEAAQHWASLFRAFLDQNLKQ